MRRPVMEDEGFSDFKKDAGAVLGENYLTTLPHRSAVTTMEEGRFVSAFRQAECEPHELEIEELVRLMAKGIGDSLKGSKTPRRLSTPLGQLGVYGKYHDVIGVEIGGWGGPKSRYHEGTFSSRFVHESAIVAGAISSMFEVEGVDVRNLANGNPHVSLGRKINGGGISDSELNGITNRLNEVGVPEEIDVFDPIINIRRGSGDDPVPVWVRPPRQANVVRLAE